MTVEQDEILLRKRARRRLVGAILLTLIVVLSLPLVLEDPSQPLGDGPEIVIPEPSKVEPPRPTSVPDSLPDDTVGEEALPVEGGSGPPVPAAPAGHGNGAKPVASPAPSAADRAAAVTAAKPDGGSPPADKSAKPGAASRAYVLQLGVFNDRANADRVAAQATALGLSPAVAQTGEGSWRVGIGPFDDRAEALAARDKVREAGLPVVIKAP
ncbi:MAG: hypothetical protein FGM40_07215 [Rhodocyclaceae bacterium]|nr:hypothetical protein [Rhodocyclaceae bacterium]